MVLIGFFATFQGTGCVIGHSKTLCGVIWFSMALRTGVWLYDMELGVEYVCCGQYATGNFIWQKN